MLDELAKYSTELIEKKVAEGNDGKINGDNLDVYVTTNDMRMKEKNRDYHFFASDITFDRLNSDQMENAGPIGDVNNLSYLNFVTSAPEEKLYKDSLKILLGRILTDYIEDFSWMKHVIPNHIPHDLEDVMCKRSEVFWLPVMLKNEARYSDCVQIMTEYERLVCEWYTKAGRGNELDCVRVPVGGDQLTRVRLQGAKALKAGALTAEDRLEHLDPIIVEMFHTLQDFIEKLYKRFYNSASGREKGTMSHLKILIQRSNVNGNVKSRFEAHEDFVLTVGCAYLLSYILKHFEMDSLNDSPKHPLLRNNMGKMHTKEKERIFSILMDEVVDKLVETFPRKNPDVPLKVKVLGEELVVTSTAEGNMLRFTLSVNSQEYIINVTPEQAEAGTTVNIRTADYHIPIEICTVKQPQDELLNYVLQFLQWYFIILSFKDAVKEGDTQRNNVNLKLCIPLFYSHSSMSKYMEECIDYILKTEVMLSHKMAMKVRAASFVNLTGKKGCNKAADLQKENEVCVLKELIRGLGANKTEKAIVTISKAAPVVQKIVDNFDRMLNIKDKKTHHSKKSFKGDVHVLLKEIIPLQIWTTQRDRRLTSFPDISQSPFKFGRLSFEMTVMAIVNRLKRGISLPEVDTDDEE